MKLYQLVTIILLFCSFSIFSQIRINEVCAANSASYYDEDHDTPDWIELYNYSNEPVNMKNWRISDNSDYESAWQFPDTVIQPGGYLLVMASGKNRVSENIKLSSNGLNTATNNFYDNLSLLYIPLNGNNEFKVKYNSFEFEIDSTNLYAVLCLMLKDKLESKSRMISLNILNDLRNEASVLSRIEEEKYRSNELIAGKYDSKRYNYSIKVIGDSVFANIYDQNDYPIVTRAFYLSNLEDYYIGFSVLSRDSNNFISANINSIWLNDNKVNIEKFSKQSFFDKNFFIEEETFLHTNFKLSSESDSLILFKNGSVYQILTLPSLSTDETIVVQNDSIIYLDSPTPNSENSFGYEIKNKIISLDSIPKVFDSIYNRNIEEDNLYFTKNFSLPDENSNNLDSITENKTSIYRIRKISDNAKNSDIKSISFINSDDLLTENYHFFIYADSFELFNETYGVIGANHSTKWIPAFCTLVSGNREILLNGEIELRKHGNVSNVNRDQSSMRVDFKERELYEKFSTDFFKNKKETFGKTINLRNGGNDFYLYMRDAISQRIASKLELEWSDCNHTWVYINGNFWGLYNIRERIDDDYLAEKYKIEKNQVNYFDNDLWIKYGTNSDLLELNNELDWLTAEELYIKSDSLINHKSLIDYIFVESYVLNHDWPHNNVNAWKPDGGKWRFILNDLDYSLKLKGIGDNVNNLKEIFENDTSFVTRLFGRLIEYDKFRIHYLNRICDHFNTDFSYEILNQIFLEFKSNLAPFAKLQNQKWSESMVNWDTEVERINRFFSGREQHYLDFTKEQLNLPGLSNLTLSTYPTNSGTFKVNTITIDTSDWQGRYFQTIPVTITAVPKHGMKFVKWNHDSLGTEPTITTTMPETYHIEAIYEQDNPQEKDEYIVINEIMYNADKDEDTKDWVELYNAGKNPVNLKGWSFIDEDDSHPKFTIEEEYTIQPDEYLILTREVAEFEKFISIPNKKIGDFQFGLGGNDILRLYDANGNLHDSVNYDNDTPWPLEADGSGYTIELRNPVLDNNIGSNWERSQELLGTPGKINSNYDTLETSIEYSSQNNDITIWKENNNLFVKSNDFINEINIYDVRGKLLISKEISTKYLRNETVDINTLKRGVYIVLVKTKSGLANFKLLIEE